MAKEEYIQQMRDMYGNEVKKLLIEQLQSGEESIASEFGRTDVYASSFLNWRTNDFFLVHFIFLFVIHRFERK